LGCTIKKIKVLVVDDHQEFRRVVRDFLNRLPNINIVGEAGDGDEAIEKAEILSPDVILMDIAMPRKNGLEATRIIKQRWPDIKIMIETGNDDQLSGLEAAFGIEHRPSRK
jgi:DNA-binding NarL/FixJ family response regulator